MNGECLFGPSETWPAQIDDYSFLVTRNHSHRKFNYETLKHILLLEKPNITKRNYETSWEYERTIKELFNATISGMKLGKIERVISRRERRANIPFKKFRKEKVSEKIYNSDNGLLLGRIENLRNSVESYHAINKIGFPYLKE